MISPNAFCSQVFPSAFGINKERLIETGYPRNDFIVNATKDDVFRIKKKLNIPMDKKSYFMLQHGVIIHMLRRGIHLS